MHPLKILAIIIAALPIVAFLLTMILTDGAPLHSLSPREESGPAAAMPALPQAKQERHSSVAAVGHMSADELIVEKSVAEAALPPDKDVAPPHMLNIERDAQVFFTLFGVPHPGLPPSP